MIRLRRPRWLRKETWIGTAPAGDLGSLDVANGMDRAPFPDWDETRPTGEVPPMTDQQAARLMADLYRGCPVCSWVPPHPRFRVLTHLPDGAHYSRSMDAPDVPVYDREMPLASEVEAWLAGGAK